MREARCHSVERGCGNHRDPPADAGEGLGDLGADRRVEVCMQFEIEAGEFDLAQGIERRVEGARAEQALQHVDRQRLTGGHVRGYERQHLAPPHEILHELTRQLDGVPCHPVDARNAGISDLGEHVMQAVAELVKQRGDFVVRQEGRSRRDRSGEVAYQLRDRQRVARGQRLGDDAFVHPCAAALLGARIGIEVEAGDDFVAGVQQIVKADAGMPHADRRSLTHADSVQALRQREQTCQYLGKRKIRPQRLLRDLESALLQAFAIESNVPGVQLAPGELFEIGELLTSGRHAAPRQVAQETEHLLAALRHPGRERIVGEAVESEQLREFVTQRQQLGDEGTIVEATRARANFGASRDPGFVNVMP